MSLLKVHVQRDHRELVYNIEPSEVHLWSLAFKSMLRAKLVMKEKQISIVNSVYFPNATYRTDMCEVNSNSSFSLSNHHQHHYELVVVLV